MRYLSFILSMPKVNTWNGSWTGKDKKYVRAISFNNKDAERIEAILQAQPFYHDFGDGWVAAVHVTEVSSKDAAKIKKVTDGFMGYDWMITSIVNKGAIETL